MESELTLNRIKDAIISVDKEWRYVFLNDAALDTHPLGREATLGKTIWEIHPQMVDSMFWHTYHRAMETGTIAEFESYYKTMDKWFSVKAYPSDTGLTIFYQDIDKSKRMRIWLAKSEEKYRALFYKSPLPIWLYDVETLNFIDVNEAAINHYGYSRSEFLAMTIKDIRPEEDVEEFLGFMREVRNDSETSRNSHWRHCKKKWRYPYR
ncbi:MAG: PAS domain-containing protein [Flavobacterium sp.]